MAIALVQSKTGYGNTADVTLVLDSAPTAGNLLVAPWYNPAYNGVYTTNNYSGAVSFEPSSFSKAAGIAYKIAEAGEAASQSFLNIGTFSSWVASLHEFSFASTSVLDGAGGNEGLTASAISTTATAERLILALATDDNSAIWGAWQINSSTTGLAYPVSDLKDPSSSAFNMTVWYLAEAAASATYTAAVTGTDHANSMIFVVAFGPPPPIPPGFGPAPSLQSPHLHEGSGALLRY